MDVRFDVIDADGNPVAEINPHQGATVKFTAADTVQRTLSGINLSPEDTATVDLFAHRLRPVWIDADGEWPLGVFVWVSRSMSRLGGPPPRTDGMLWADSVPIWDGETARWGTGRQNTTWNDRMLRSGQLHDLGALLANEMDRAYSLPDGALIRTALQQLHGEVGIATDIAPTEARTAGALAWPMTQHRAGIVRQLCQLAGLAWHIDGTGTAVIRPIPDPALDPPDHSYDTGAASTIVHDTVNESDDLLDRPNVYRVISTAPTGGPIVGEFRLPASSPGSVESRGFEVFRTIEEPGVASPLEAARIAREHARQDAAVVRTVTLQTLVNPRHEGHAVVELEGSPYLEQGWTVDLSSALQTHELRQVVTL